MGVRTEEQVIKEDFPKLKTPRELALMLHIGYDRLVYHIYKVPPIQKYIQFIIRDF